MRYSAHRDCRSAAAKECVSFPDEQRIRSGNSQLIRIGYTYGTSQRGIVIDNDAISKRTIHVFTDIRQQERSILRYPVYRRAGDKDVFKRTVGTVLRTEQSAFLTVERRVNHRKVFHSSTRRARRQKSRILSRFTILRNVDIHNLVPVTVKRSGKLTTSAPLRRGIVRIIQIGCQNDIFLTAIFRNTHIRALAREVVLAANNLIR